MENMKLELPVSLEPQVAIAIRKFLGTVPSDQIGLPVLVALDNAINESVSNQMKQAEEDYKLKPTVISP